MGYNRRLPVYLLVDCSESMAGPAIEAVGKGIESLISHLKGDALALETAAVSVITFASKARQLVPLTELVQLQVIPRLVLGSGTALGAGLELWTQCMDREVVRTTSEQRGDYKPVAFLLTDGEPTDAWEGVADRIKSKVVGHRANLIAVAYGPDSDPEKLGRITDNVVLFSNASAETLTAFFKWTSASVSSLSRSVSMAGDAAAPLAELPASLQGPEQTRRPPSDADRFVFLHARCTTHRSFYLMKFQRPERSSARYLGVASYPLDDFEFAEDGSAGLKVSTGQLQSPPGCPYCENPDWAMCRKGHVHCCPRLTGAVSLTCPWCHVTETYQGAIFDVGRGAG